MKNKTLYCWNISIDDEGWIGNFETAEEAYQDAIQSTPEDVDIYIGTCHRMELPEVEFFVGSMLEEMENDYYEDVGDSSGRELFSDPYSKDTSIEYKTAYYKFVVAVQEAFNKFCKNADIKPTYFKVDQTILVRQGGKENEKNN